MKPCKIWAGCKTKHGYGQRRIKQKTLYVHRLEWEKHHGPIPPGVDICHSCDNPPCYEIEHLFTGDAKINGQDASTKGRMVNGVRHHAHKLTEAQVLAIRADPRPGRTIALDYPVCRSMISFIKARKNWKHL